MADLLNPDTTHERSTLRTLLLAATALLALAAASFAIFFHHEDHAPVQLTSTRTLALPLHTTYTHTGKSSGGPDGGEDTTYVVTALHLQDRASVPLFIKDITGTMQLADGTPVPFTRIKAADLDRLLQIVPTLRPVLQQIATPPLQLEQTIATGASADGYVLFQFAGPQSVWNARKDATITLDFYHQDPVTVTVK
jgi:hypothetical protein